MFSPAERLGFTAVIEYAGAPLVLDWWQKDFLRRDERFSIIVKTRRAGWSFETALKGFIKSQDFSVKKYRKIFVSYNLADATEKIAYARELYEGTLPAYRKKLVSESKTSMEFLDAGGRTTSRLISFPCKAPRGQSGDLSLDEFAFYQNANAIYSGSLPTIVLGNNSIEIGSTPYGQKGRFYEIFTDKKTYPEYRRFSLPWWYSSSLCKDVAGAAAGFAAEMDTDQRVTTWGKENLVLQYRNSPLEDFQQEFELSFRDELASYITLEMIQGCTPLGDQEHFCFSDLDDFLLAYDPAVHGTLYAGYDVGRTRDASELIIVGLLGDKPRPVWHSCTLLKKPFDEQQAFLSKVLARLPVRRLCIDATGLGMHLAENLRGQFGDRVEEITFTPDAKEELAQGLYLAMQRREILLPANRELARQIHAIKKSVSVTGKSRFDAEREKNSHADKFWALALAVGASSNPGRKKSGFYSQVAGGKKVA